MKRGKQKKAPKLDTVQKLTKAIFMDKAVYTITSISSVLFLYSDSVGLLGLAG